MLHSARVHVSTLAVVVFVLAGAAAVADAQEEQTLPAGWSAGPTTGSLGSRAQIKVPEGFFFLDGPAAQKFLTDTQNIPDGDEVGALVRYRSEEDSWFVIFSYADTGHIDDGDKNDLDAEDLLETIRKGTEAANKERRKRGWGTMEVVGWHSAPFYDPATNNLTWAITGSDGTDQTVNRSVRLLGRTGVMSAQLVVDAARADLTTAEFDEALAGYEFTSGSRYFEFKKGDKIAGYGLSALVGAGAAGVAIKTGLLQKFWKLIVVGVVGALAAVKRFLARLTGRSAANGQASV